MAQTHTESIEALTTWAQATADWDEGSTKDSVERLLEINKPNSKILFNIGCAQMFLGNKVHADQTFTATIAKDEHMAIAYFQRGCVRVKLNRLRDAVSDFEECQKCFRGRSVIDYSQLGLKYKLYLCEAIHNAGVAESIDGNWTTAEQLLDKAIKSKVERRHNVIEDSLQTLKNREKPAVLEIPKEAIYRPPKGKVENLAKKNYLGKAKVISAVDQEDNFSGFIGPRKIEEQRRCTPPHSPNLQSRLRGSPTPPRTHSPTLRSKEEVLAPSRDFTPKLKRFNIAENGNAKVDQIICGSKEEGVFKAPQQAAPVLPPRDNAVHVTSEASKEKSGSARSSRLPPPPNRPPPKLDRKPLPQLPLESKLPGATVKMVRVKLHCNTTKVIDVKPKSSLSSLVRAACVQFGLGDDSIDLWRRKSENGEIWPITSEDQMQVIWEKHTGQEPLSLWCYAKQ